MFMKKRKIFITVLVVALSLSIYIIFNMISGVEKVKLSKDEKLILAIPVISDIHIGGIGADMKFEEALRDYEELYGNYDAIAIVGDIVDTCKKVNYENFKKILRNGTPPNADKIIAMGNHEYYFEDTSKEDYEKRFMEELKLKSLYYDKWIKGYHFIVLAPEHEESAKPSKKQLFWLETKLKETRDSKPIFIFLHQPFKDTVFGSEDSCGIENDQELYDILKKYPQIIFFSGHSHYDLANEKTIVKKEFTMINTSAIYYVMNYNDSNEPIYKTQGLALEVYDSKVIIRRREVITKQWIGEPYIIEYKDDHYKSVR